MIAKELEARIGKIEDIQDINSLQAQYAYLVDTLQMDKVLDLFADNFIADYDRMGSFQTKVELLDFLSSAATGATMMYHQMMTPYIEIDGDKARGTWYLFGPFTFTTPQGEIATWMQGKYDNEFVRVADRWKFSHLSFKLNMQCSYEDGWVKTRKTEA